MEVQLCRGGSVLASQKFVECTLHPVRQFPMSGTVNLYRFYGNQFSKAFTPVSKTVYIYVCLRDKMYILCIRRPFSVCVSVASTISRKKLMNIYIYSISLYFFFTTESSSINLKSGMNIRRKCKKGHWIHRDDDDDEGARTSLENEVMCG